MKTITATKIEVLRFIGVNQVVQAGDLANEFGYTLGTARNKIYRLQKVKLIEKVGIRVGTYCLTNEAIRRLEHHEQR